MELIGKLKRDVESAADKTEAKKILSNTGIVLDDTELDAVAGGCGVVNMIIGDPQCDCSGTDVDMIAIGTDSTGRITYWQCPLCGKQESVYG